MMMRRELLETCSRSTVDEHLCDVVTCVSPYSPRHDLSKIPKLENRPPQAAQFPLRPSLRWSSDHTHCRWPGTSEVFPAAAAAAADALCLPPS